MPTTLDTIAIEFGAQWTGGGVINRIITDLSRVARATRDVYDPVKSTGMITGIGTQSQAFAAAGASALQYRAQLQNVERQMLQLGQAMAGLGSESNPFTGMSSDQAVQQYQQLAMQANELKKSLEGVNQVAGDVGGLNSFIRAIAPWAVVLGATTAAIIGMAKAFSAWKAAAEEGAAIRQTAVSFEFLSDQLYNMPGLLDKMRSAARGTISDFQLMSSYLTLMAGTTPEFGSALSAAVPQLINIAKAANVLNPALGDTTFFFESLARGIKRTEYRLIDNLGLNVRVGEANRRYAEALGKTVTQLSAAERQQAFLNEVLRVGALLVDQIGGSVDSLTDPYQQLTANTENLTNTFKELASVTFAPIAEGMAAQAGELNQLVQNLTGSMEQLNKADTQGGFFGGIYASILEGSKMLPLVGPIIKGLDLVMETVTRFNDLMDHINSGKSVWSFITGEKTFSAPFEAIKEGAGGAEAAFAALTASATGALIAGREIGTEFAGLGKEAQVSESKVHALAKAITLLRLKAKPDAVAALLANLDAMGNKANVAAAAMANLNRAMNMTPWLEAEAALSQAQLNLNDQLRDSWAAINAEREAALSSSWLDIFAGGDFDSDLIVGNIRNIGDAWVTTSGATAEQSDRLEELTGEMEKLQTKLQDVNNGIGVQGDSAESVAKKVGDLSAEIANYQSLISNLQSQIAPSTTQRVHFGLNLKDVEVFRQFVQVLGDVGGTTEKLGGVAVALGLISPAAADAMQKVSLLELALQSIALSVKIGDITVENGAQAVKDVIAMLEQDISAQELTIQVRTQLADARGGALREWHALPQEERTGEVNVDANVDPALKAVGQALGFVGQQGSQVKVDADTKPFYDALDTARTTVEAMKLTLVIQGVYVPPPNLPQTTTATTSGPPPHVPRSSWGIDKATPDTFISSANAEKLAAGFFSGTPGVGAAHNKVSLQNNFYAPVGSSDIKKVIVEAGGDAAEQLVEVLKRSGYRL